ncbi:MAG: hypothetical protein ACE5R4_12335 [Armatimonadota bacterium]
MHRVTLTICGLALLCLVALACAWLGSAVAQQPAKAPVVEAVPDKAAAAAEAKALRAEKLKAAEDREAFRLLKASNQWQGGQMVVEGQDIYILLGPYLYRFDRELELVKKLDLRKVYTEEELALMEAKKAQAARKVRPVKPEVVAPQ